MSDLKTAPIHPVAYSIDSFLNRVADIELLAKLFFLASLKYLKAKGESIKQELNELKIYVKDSKNIDNAFVIKKFEKIILSKDKLFRSQIYLVLETSLFNSLFSAFDTFQGDMLSSLFRKRPDLFSKLNRTIQ
jgi:hypothetical protein